MLSYVRLLTRSVTITPTETLPYFPIATQTEEVDRETTADCFIVSLSVCRIRVSGDGLQTSQTLLLKL